MYVIIGEKGFIRSMGGIGRCLALSGMACKEKERKNGQKGKQRKKEDPKGNKVHLEERKKEEGAKQTIVSREEKERRMFLEGERERETWVTDH